MSNYALIGQKILNIGQSSNTFAFSLSTLHAIDTSVPSLQDAFDNLNVVLSANGIITILDNNNSLLVFIRGGNTAFDLIPKTLIGSQLAAINNPFNMSYITTNPDSTLINNQDLIIDARFYGLPVPDAKGHTITVGGGATIVPDTMGWQTRCLNLNSTGYIQIGATPDLIVNGNFTHCLNFIGSLNVVTGGLPTYTSIQSAAGAICLLDTQSIYGEGFLFEAQLSIIDGTLTANWHLRVAGADYYATIDAVEFVKWSRLAIVNLGNTLTVYYNGVSVFGLQHIPFTGNEYPYQIFIGAWANVPETFGDSFS